MGYPYAARLMHIILGLIHPFVESNSNEYRITLICRFYADAVAIEAISIGRM